MTGRVLYCNTLCCIALFNLPVHPSMKGDEYIGRKVEILVGLVVISHGGEVDDQSVCKFNDEVWLGRVG